MSKSSNKKKINHNNYIKLAFEQAKINLGSTGLNPSVGCVIEKNGSIISSAHTSVGGRPHAEHIALVKKKKFKNSNLYVTLEPCCHYGVTPPCINKIISKKIKNVYFSIVDYDIRTANLSTKKLINKKISIKKNILYEYGNLFYKSYYLSKNNLFPYIDAKIAISKDYFTKNLKKKFITNKHSLSRSHLLRSQYDSIVSTSKSINEDNSRLDCRIEGMTYKSPKIFIIDRFLKLKKELDIYKKNNDIYLLTTIDEKKKLNFFTKKGIKIINFKNMSSVIDYSKIFSKIQKIGGSRIMLESGLTFLNFMILSNFINYLYVFKSSNNLKKFGINYGKIDILKKIKLSKKIKVNLMKDKLYRVKLK